MKKASARKAPPVLRHFAGLWTLSGQPSREKEWSLEQKFAEAKKAGFDAIGGGANPEVVALCGKYGLEYICYTDADGKNFKEKLDAVKKVNPARVNVQLLDHDTPPREAAAVWVKMAAYAQKIGLNADLEVHRDTCTETPEKTYEIAERFRKATGKKISFCWDFSHLAVVKHLNPPYADRLLVDKALVRQARQFHFRPFNGHHCQVPATDGRGRATPEFEHYHAFLEALIGLWIEGARGGEVIYACPEFGPIGSGYGLTCFPNVWQDAIFTREVIATIWKNKVKAFKG